MCCFYFNWWFFFVVSVVIHRYIDVLTSNSSIEDLHRMLETPNQRHPNIKLTHGIHSTVSFLDARIERKQNQLIISVYHKSALEPYVVPFRSHHPRHVFRMLFKLLFFKLSVIHLHWNCLVKKCELFDWCYFTTDKVHITEILFNIQNESIFVLLVAFIGSLSDTSINMFGNSSSIIRPHQLRLCRPCMMNMNISSFLDNF